MIRPERVTTALLELLAGAVGKPVGDHGTKNPDGSPIDTSGQYSVLYKIDGGGVQGSVGDPHQTMTLVYQIDSVGRSRQQCEGLADANRRAMVALAPEGGPLQILAGDGWRGGLRSQQTTGMPQPEGVDDGGRGVWTQRERFDVEVVPAGAGEVVITPDQELVLLIDGGDA